jgi:hypothetical protein
LANPRESGGGGNGTTLAEGGIANASPDVNGAVGKEERIMSIRVGKLALGLAGILATSGSFISSASADLYCTTDVKELYQWHNGRISILGSNFSSNGKSVVVCDPAQSDYCAQILSVLEAAQLSGRKVRVRMAVSSCGTTLPEYPGVTAVTLN